MNIKRKFSLIAFFLCIIFLNAQTLKIGTGYKGGKYSDFAFLLQDILKKDSNIRLQVINTQGSIENISKLKKGELDLALIQSDILFRDYKAFPSSKNYPIIPIASLYKEPIFIVTNKNFVVSIKDLYNRVVNIGPAGSGIEDSAKILLKVNGIYNFVQLQFLPIHKSIQALLNNRVDAIFLNKIPQKLKKLIQEKKLFLIPVSYYTLHNLHSTFPYYEIYEYKLDNFRTITTLAVRVILVGNNTLSKSAVYTILKELFFKKSSFSNYLSDSLFDTNPIGSWHKGTIEFAKDYNIKLTYDSIKDSSVIYIIIAVILIFILFFIFIVLILYYSYFFHKFESLHKLIHLSHNFYKWIFFNKYKMIIILTVTIFFIFALFIKFYEHKWAVINSQYSIFDSYSFYKILIWLFIFGSSGYNDNIFPVSPEGKFFASMVHFVSLSGLIAMVGFYIYDKIKQYIVEVNGMGTKKIKNHILLCGWNNTAQTIINSLTHKNLVNKNQIVIIVENEATLQKIQKYNFDPLYVHYIIGKTYNHDDLDRANFKDANIAIILADSGNENPDAATILSVLTIEKYSKELLKKGKRKKDIYTIAEIKNKQNISLAYEANADEVISLGDIETKLFTQAVMNPGIADFMQEVLTLNEENDIYSYVIEKNSPLIGKTFDETLLLLRKFKILLLSFNVGYKKSKSIQAKILQKYHLNNPVITNPFLENECNYKLQEGDLIIVLAQYEKVLIDALNTLKTLNAVKS